MAARDERVHDLFFVDITAQGDPSEEGQVRYTNSSLKIYMNGSVQTVLFRPGSIVTSGSGGDVFVFQSSGDVITFSA